MLDLSTCTKPVYPIASIRAEEAGTVALRFQIASGGQVVSAVLQRSSGFPNLDKAALSSLSKCHFNPAVDEDGRVVTAWAHVDYVWKLEEDPNNPWKGIRVPTGKFPATVDLADVRFDGTSNASAGMRARVLQRIRTIAE